MQRRRPPSGSPPGALAGRQGARPARIEAYVYDAGGMRRLEVREPAELVPLREATGQKLWVDVQGLDDTATLERVARIFDVHPLALADAVNTPQRPKADTYGEHLVLVTQMVRPDGAGGMTVEQLTIVVGRDFVVTFQDLEHGDVLDPVRARLGAGKNPLCERGSDYLAYAMVDTVVDGYYPVLEAIGERLEAVETEVVSRPTPELLKAVQRIKRDLLTLRRSLWPERDALAALTRGDSAVVAGETRLYLRDCYDHAIQLIDVVETYRELATSLTDAYISSLSNRLNEVMKVLTVISTVFMPLSFLASLYGMNFQHMPELQTTYGYPVLLAFMVAIATGMLVWFRRKGWLGGTDARGPGAGREGER